MTSKRLARQTYIKEWKRARREVLNVRALVRAQIDAADAADRAEKYAQRAGRTLSDQQPHGPLHNPDIQPVEMEEQPDELMGEPTGSVSSSEQDSSSDGSALDTEMWDTPTNDAYNKDNNPESSFRNMLQQWALKHHIPHSALDELLVGLKLNGHPELPSTARTLLSTPTDIRSTTVSGMECVHFGLKRTIKDQLRHYPDEVLKDLNRLTIFFSKTSGMTLGEGMAVLIKLMKEQKAIQFQIRRTMEEHMGRVTRRMEAIERRIDGLEAAVLSSRPQHQAPQQEEVLLSQCKTVEELDRSLAQPETKNQMKRFLGSLGGANPGAAVRRMLRQVATNQVLGEYSLRGRRAKKAFQGLALYKVVTEACMQKYPLTTVADIEECISHALKLAPHRRPAPQDGTD
ncbi:uncharacterized protein PAE49_019354 isoform 2-T3 [Odontesthes bonariensis]